MTLIFLIIAGFISVINTQDQKNQDQHNEQGNIEPYQFPVGHSLSTRQQNRNQFQRPYDQVIRQFPGMSGNQQAGPQFNTQRFPSPNRQANTNGGNANNFRFFQSFNRPPNRMQPTRQGNNFSPRTGSTLSRPQDRQYPSQDYSDDYYSVIHEETPNPTPRRGNFQPNREPGTFQAQPKIDDFDYYDSAPTPKKSQAAKHPVMIYQPGVGYIESTQYEQSRRAGPSSLSYQPANLHSTSRNNKIPEYDYNSDYNQKGHSAQLNSPNGQSCPTRSGMYGDPSSSCQNFYTCQTDGRIDTGKCPTSTKFNNKVGVCDYAYKIDDSCNPLPGFEEPPPTKQKNQYEMSDSPDDYQQPQYGANNGNKQTDYYEQ